MIIKENVGNIKQNAVKHKINKPDLITKGENKNILNREKKGKNAKKISLFKLF